MWSVEIHNHRTIQTLVSREWLWRCSVCEGVKLILYIREKKSIWSAHEFVIFFWSSRLWNFSTFKKNHFIYTTRNFPTWKKWKMASSTQRRQQRYVRSSTTASVTQLLSDSYNNILQRFRRPPSEKYSTADKLSLTSNR